jgi:hypothetical protein
VCKNYSTSSGENLAELEIIAIKVVVEFDVQYLVFLIILLQEDPSFYDTVTQFVNGRHKNNNTIKSICINHLKKSKDYREAVIQKLNNYKFVFENEDQILVENAFVA